MLRGELTAALLAVAASGPANAQDGESLLAQRLLGTQITVGAGGYSSGYTFEGGAWGDGFLTQHVEGRWVPGGFTLEAGILHTLPIATGGASQAFTGHLRLGWTWSRATVTLGALAQFAPRAAVKTQWLPTLSAAYAFDRFGLSAGVFDVQGLAIARVSFEHEHFGVGYVLPLGVEARGRVRVSPAASLQIQALAFRAFNAQLAYLVVSGTFGAAGGGAP